MGVLIALVASWVALHAAGGFADAFGALRDVRLSWLAAAAVIEALSYVALGGKLRALIGRPIGPVEAVEIGFVISGFGLLTPASPAEGLAITAGHLRRRGLSGRRVAFVLTFNEWFSLSVFLVVSSIDLLVVAALEPDPLRSFWPFFAAAVVVLGLLAVVLRAVTDEHRAARAFSLLATLRRGERHTSPEARLAAGRELHRDARSFLGSRVHVVRVAAMTAGAMLGDVACLWCAMRAAGGRVGFDVALLAVAMASFAILIPLVPGGLGFVEATIPAVAHHFGMPYDQGLAAALVYRCLGTFLPASVGLGAIVALRRRARAER